MYYSDRYNPHPYMRIWYNTVPQAVRAGQMVAATPCTIGFGSFAADGRVVESSALAVAVSSALD